MSRTLKKRAKILLFQHLLLVPKNKKGGEKAKKKFFSMLFWVLQAWKIVETYNFHVILCSADMKNPREWNKNENFNISRLLSDLIDTEK